MIHNLFDITGKKAIVTGGTRGLLEAGCEVCIVGSSEKSVAGAVAKFQEKGFACQGVHGDMSVREEVYRVFQ